MSALPPPATEIQIDVTPPLAETDSPVKADMEQLFGTKTSFFDASLTPAFLTSLQDALIEVGRGWGGAIVPRDSLVTGDW